MGRMTLMAMVLVGYGPLALAQDRERAPASVETLASTLEQLQRRHASSEASRHVFEHALTQAAILVDPHAAIEDRKGAAEWLSRLPTLDLVRWLDARGLDDSSLPDPDSLDELIALIHEKSLGFIAAASRDPAPSVRLAAIAAAPEWGDAAVRLLRERARRDRMQLQRMALDGLGRVGTVAAADALYEMASEKLLLNEMVEHAWAVLAREFPEYLASRGGLPDYLANKGGLPQAIDHGIGQTAAVAASAVAGGVFLSSVGTWGKSDLGIDLGRLGGGAIGAGTGYLYTRQNPLSAGQGLRYASNVAWGLVGSQLVNEAAFGFDQTENSDGHTTCAGDCNAAALIRTLGTGAGAWLGFRAMQNAPTTSDVMETNAGGILGASAASSIFQLATHRRDFDRLSEPSRRTLEDSHQRQHSLVALSGSALGLGVGTAVMDRWEPDVPDVAYAGMSAFVLADAGRVADGLMDSEVDSGLRSVSGNLGAIGGLVAAHGVNPDLNTVGVASSYSLIGKLAGVGIGRLSGLENGAERFSSPFSIAGMVGGTLASKSITLAPNHLAFTGLGTAVFTANAAELTNAMRSEERISSRTHGGTVALVGAASSGTLLAVSRAVNPDANTLGVAGSYALIGKVAGVGVGQLSGLENGAQWFGSPLSIAGMVGGTLASRSITLAPNHLAFTGLGTAVLTANAAAVTTKMRSDERISNRTRNGTVSLVGAASAGTLLAVSSAVEPSNDQTIFAATGAGWGLYYGSLVQLVIPGELPIEDATLITTGVMDAGILTAAWMSSDAVGVKPKDTYVPQLCGLAGGTLGALGVMLASENPRAIVTGALVGSTAGLVGGTMVGPKLSGRSASARKRTGIRRSFTAKIPGSWSMIAVPSFNEDGSLGGNVQVAATGL